MYTCSLQFLAGGLCLILLPMLDIGLWFFMYVFTFAYFSIFVCLYFYRCCVSKMYLSIVCSKIYRNSWNPLFTLPLSEDWKFDGICFSREEILLGNSVNRRNSSSSSNNCSRSNVADDDCSSVASSAAVRDATDVTLASALRQHQLNTIRFGTSS